MVKRLLNSYKYETYTSYLKQTMKSVMHVTSLIAFINITCKRHKPTSRLQ